MLCKFLGMMLTIHVFYLFHLTLSMIRPKYYAAMIYWFTPWEGSVAVIAAIGVVIILYLRGCSKSKPSFRQKLYFWKGLISVYLVSYTQFDYYSQHQFFIHRIQHLILHHLGLFLIIVSNPLSVLHIGMPKKGRYFST